MGKEEIRDAIRARDPECAVQAYIEHINAAVLALRVRQQQEELEGGSPKQLARRSEDQMMCVSILLSYKLLTLYLAVRKKLEAAKFGVSEVPLCELVSMAFVPALILRNYKIRGKS